MHRAHLLNPSDEATEPCEALPEGFDTGLAVAFAGKEAELKFELRNLTNTKYQEFQESGDNKIFYNRYRQGISASVGVEINF